MDMTDKFAQEAELLALAAGHLKSAQCDKPIEAQQMYLAAAVASIALATELSVRRDVADGHSPATTRAPTPKFFIENDEEFEARVRRNHAKWDSGR